MTHAMSSRAPSRRRRWATSWCRRAPPASSIARGVAHRRQRVDAPRSHMSHRPTLPTPTPTYARFLEVTGLKRRSPPDGNDDVSQIDPERLRPSRRTSGRRGIDPMAIERALAELVDRDSFRGDTGIRARALATFPQPGRPRDVFERVDDAAQVHRLTGTARAVALHFPWDAPRTSRAARPYRRPRTTHGRRQPEPVPGPRVPARARSAIPTRGSASRAVATCWNASQIADALGSDGTVAVARRRDQLRRPGRPTRAALADARRAAARLRRATGRTGAADRVQAV